MRRITVIDDDKRDFLTALAAKIHGVTPRYVNMVRKCERDNDDIENTLVELRQCIEEKANELYEENLMVKAVKKAIPFN